MLYMVIEDFRDGDAAPVYRRLREQGRQVPEGLTYRAPPVASGQGTFALPQLDQQIRDGDGGSPAFVILELQRPRPAVAGEVDAARRRVPDGLDEVRDRSELGWGHVTAAR